MDTFKNIVLTTVGLLVLYSCSSEKRQEKEQEKVQVEVYSPNQAGSDGFYLSGQVTAEQTATISTRMMGFVRKIYVKPGDKVTQGQLLISISNDEVMAKKSQAQAMIIEAEAAMGNARKDYERFKRLHEQSSVSDKEFENAELYYTSMNAKSKMAQQALNEVNAMLAYTDIRSPFSGVITRKMIDEGSMANPGMPLLIVEQKGGLIVEASVPENYIRYVKIGDKAKIELKSIAETITGMVTELSPSAYGTGGQYAVKLSIDGNDSLPVHSGMYATVFIQNERMEEISGKLMIESSSVVYRDQLTGVYVVNEQAQAVLRWIRLGKQTGNQYEVLSGINQNDRVIRNAAGKLYNGREVVITE